MERIFAAKGVNIPSEKVELNEDNDKLGCVGEYTNVNKEKLRKVFADAGFTEETVNADGTLKSNFVRTDLPDFFHKHHLTH